VYLHDKIIIKEIYAIKVVQQTIVLYNLNILIKKYYKYVRNK